MKLSIVIPAFNEQRRLRPTLEAYVGYFASHLGDRFEILIVDDGSTDQTRATAQEYARRHPQVVVWAQPLRMGKGRSLLTGLSRASGEFIGYVDADGATQPEDFHELLNRIGSADAIIASRWLKESQVSPPQPLSRRTASRCFNFLVRRMFGLEITDTQCGAKLIRREALQVVLPHIGVSRWAFDVDMLFALHRAGFRIIELPTRWHDKEGSRLRIVGASVEMMLAITRLRLLYSRFSWIVSLYDATLGRFFHRRNSAVEAPSQIARRESPPVK